ncbi:MAG: WD40 repeat domain-containing protein [Smithella sp.]
MTQYLAITKAASPYLAVYNAATYAAVAGTPTLEGAGYAIEFSPDGSMLAVGINASPYLVVIDTSDWSVITGTPTLYGTCHALAWSADGGMLAVAALSATATQRVMVFDPSDWSVVKDDYNLDNNSAQALAFSNDGAYLAIGYGYGNRLIVADVSDWSTVAGTPTLTGYVRAVMFSPDDAFLAVGYTDTPNLAIVDTSDWSMVAGTPTLPRDCQSLDFTSDGAYLACGHLNSPYLTVVDTSDWTAITGVTDPGAAIYAAAYSADNSKIAIGSPDADYFFLYDSTLYDPVTGAPTSDSGCRGVSFSPNIAENLTLLTDETIGAGVDWFYSPDIFEGLAVSHTGTVYGQGSRDAAALTVFKKMAGKYYHWNEISPVSTSHQMAVFSPGGRHLLVGGDTPPDTGFSTRIVGKRYGAIVDEKWGSLLSSGGTALSLSWTDDDKYHVGNFYDIYGRVPLVMAWDSTSQAYVRPGNTGLEELRYYRRSEISPNGDYVVTTASYSELYDQSPFIFVSSNDRSALPAADFTPVDVELGAVSLPTTYGLQVSWSPDSVYFVVSKYVFKWISANSRFEIIATLTAADPVYRAAWSPDSVYLAISTGTDTAYIYKRTGDSFASLTSKVLTGTATAFSWSKDGASLFIGTSSNFYQYDQSGDTFTLNEANDFSAIAGAVVSIDTSRGLQTIAGGALPTAEAVSYESYFIGYFDVAGPITTTEILGDSEQSFLLTAGALPSAEVLGAGVSGILSSLAGALVSTEALGDSDQMIISPAGALPTTEVLGSGVSELLMSLAGALVTAETITGKYVYYVPTMSAGPLTTAETISALIENPATAQYISIYRCFLTVADDGLDDLEIPISSFQARLYPSSPNYLNAVIPNGPEYAAGIAARPNGDIVIRKYGVRSSGYSVSSEISRANFETLSYDYGDTNKTAQISGYKTQTLPLKTVELFDVSGVSLQSNGKRRVRCGISFSARPGDTVTWDDGTESMTAGMVTITVSTVQQTMDITEA